MGTDPTTSHRISVVDVTAPTIGCPSDMVVQVAPGQCDTVLSFVATAADGCGPASLTYSHAPGPRSPRYAHGDGDRHR